MFSGAQGRSKYHVPDHPEEKATTLDLQPNQVGRCWHLCHGEPPDQFGRVHLMWKGVGKLGEVMPANEQLSSTPASHLKCQ